MNHNEKILSICKLLGEIIGKVAGWFLTTTLVYWGYLGLSCLINLPMVTYWAIFIIVMASKILNIRLKFSTIKRD